jgi:hypothetical protein
VCKGHLVEGHYRKEGDRPFVTLDEATLKEWDSTLSKELHFPDLAEAPETEIPTEVWGAETPEEVDLLENRLAGTSDSVRSSTFQEMTRIIEERDAQIVELQRQVLYWRKKAFPRALLVDDSTAGE